MALQVGTDCLSANRLLAAQFISASILVTHYPKNCAAFPVCQFLHSCLFVCLFVWTPSKKDAAVPCVSVMSVQAAQFNSRKVVIVTHFSENENAALLD